jgi:2-polyprenyl-3-methyl-5-hydroxy-6-metoxy-1,4-benzoquinol methylase
MPSKVGKLLQNTGREENILQRLCRRGEIANVGAIKNRKESGMNRGTYEERILSEAERDARKDLPAGVGLELSPFWDFQKGPHLLYKHMVRYFFITEEVWSYVVENFPVPTTVNALDVGSGYGEMRLFLGDYHRPKGYKLVYTGCDIDPLRMARARALLPSIRIEPIEPLPDGVLSLPGGYNVLICSEVYEHLEPVEGKQLLVNLYGLAQSGAVIVFTIPTPTFGKQREIPMHLNEIEPEEFLRVAREAGWELVHWYYMRGRTKESAVNIPRAMRSTLLAPQYASTGNHALYVLRRS